MDVIETLGGIAVTIAARMNDHFSEKVSEEVHIFLLLLNSLELHAEGTSISVGIARETRLHVLA